MMKIDRNPLKNSRSKAAQARYRQAMVDADIEGLARDPGAEKLVEDMRAQGVSVEERIERLKAFFANKEPRADAAE
ncbi:MAG: hypothetical protein AB7P52_05045 [Alphaproteobacteria bacterium]